MRARPVLSIFAAGLLAACGGGAGGGGLGYAVPATTSMAYTTIDTTTIGINAMGQSMNVNVTSATSYDVSFAGTANGVQVTMSVTDLEGSVAAPMTAPVSFDESAIDGDLVFELDRMGNPTVLSAPTVAVEASQAVSGAAVAHQFFPGLPNRAVSAGDQWVDTVSYNDEGDVVASSTAVLTYTVVGTTQMGGRDLLEISYSGPIKIEGSAEMGGMQLQQTAEVDTEGRVLWDQSAGVMYEMTRRGTGAGTINIPVSPAPLPITLTLNQTTRLGG